MQNRHNGARDLHTNLSWCVALSLQRRGSVLLLMHEIDADAVCMQRSQCNACGTRYRRSGVLTPLQPVENRRRPTSLQCAMKSQKELRCCPAFQGIEGPPLVTQ
mmetsp:Transcript_2796/g.17414  ORF Transcript_2796/g.17414 Transcript_2796/m.17414 type:complete len:104 (+) Transcript_2796:644-955(+)